MMMPRTAHKHWQYVPITPYSDGRSTEVHLVISWNRSDSGYKGMANFILKWDAHPTIADPPGVGTGRIGTCWKPGNDAAGRTRGTKDGAGNGDVSQKVGDQSGWWFRSSEINEVLICFECYYL